MTKTRTAYGKRTAVTYMLYCALVFLAPVCSAASQKAGDDHTDSLQAIALQGIYGDELALEPGDAVARPGPYTADASAGEETPEIAVVPLPAAAWLFGSALVGFVMMSNRHSR